MASPPRSRWTCSGRTRTSTAPCWATSMGTGPTAAVDGTDPSASPGSRLASPHEARHPRCGRATVELGGRADLLDAPLVDHRHHVAEDERLLLVVGHEHRRDRRARRAAGGPRSAPAPAGRCRGWRTARRAAGPGRGRERPGQRHPLLLATGQRRRLASAKPVEPDHGERCRATRRVRRSARRGRRRRCSADRHVREQRPVLEHHPDPALLGRDPRPVASLTTGPTVTTPASGRSSPAIDRSSVVLPDPLGPSRAHTWPGATSRDTPRSTSVEPKRLAMSTTESEEPAMAVVRGG